MGQIHLEMLKIIVYNTFLNLYKSIAVTYVILIMRHIKERSLSKETYEKSTTLNNYAITNLALLCIERNVTNQKKMTVY